ncbi:MAG TPA: ATP-binding protein [Candidatus Deferrimicrobiaceae bacterium]|nr:ATP-binding protein [Candidatus Deferrimicrobiaceae bacterium]
MRDRIAGGVLIGLVVLFSIFGLLVVRTIELSTQVALDERLRLAQLTALSMDDLVDHAARQLEAVASIAGQSGDANAAALGDELFELIDEFDQIVALDAAAHVIWVAPGGSSTAPWPLASDAAVLAALDRPSTSVIAPAGDGLANPPFVVVLVPLADGSGERVGTLAGEILAARLGDHLLPVVETSSSVQSQVVDSSGVVIAAAGSHDGEPETEHVAILAPLIASSRGGTAIHRFDDFSDHVVAFYPFATLPGGIVIEQTEDEALAIPSDMQRTLLIYGFAALLLASGGAWLHANSVVRPIRRLSTDAARMASGELDQPIVVPRDDEIGELGQRFDDMRVRLKASLDERARWAEELESRVLERTREAEERNRQLDALNRIRRQLLAKTITAQEEERKRLARDLHDDSAQTLTAVLMTLKAAEDGLPERSIEARAALVRSRTQLEMALREIRKAIVDLRPSALDDLGLGAAVRAYADDHLRPLGIDVALRVVGDERRATGSEATAIFRIVQEAVSNAARHAAARHVRIRLEFRASDMVALVEDDGAGFEPDALPEPDQSGRGLGLLGMRERAELFGGTLTVESRAGGGTRIRARLPYA